MATRHSHNGPADAHSRERFLQAALGVLVDKGVGGLTVRGLAGTAGTSTIGVYTRFGGRTGVLDALYERTFELLHDELATLPPTSGELVRDVLAFAHVYRDFALASPARYGFMFERPVPGYDPDPDLRKLAQRNCYDLLADRVAAGVPSGANADTAAYLVWATMHGLVSIELTHRARNPPPGWFLRTEDDSYDRVFRDGMTAILSGLRA